MSSSKSRVRKPRAVQQLTGVLGLCVLLSHLSSHHSIDGCCTSILFPSKCQGRKKGERAKGLSSRKTVFIFRAPTSVPIRNLHLQGDVTWVHQLQRKLGYRVFVFQPLDQKTKKGVTVCLSLASPIPSSVKVACFHAASTVSFLPLLQLSMEVQYADPQVNLFPFQQNKVLQKKNCVSWSW